MICRVSQEKWFNVQSLPLQLYTDWHLGWIWPIKGSQESRVKPRK